MVSGVVVALCHESTRDEDCGGGEACTDNCADANIGFGPSFKTSYARKIPSMPALMKSVT